MFTKTLAEQSNEEQLKLFYEPAKRFEIIGASCPEFGAFGHREMSAHSSTLVYRMLRSD
jgi:hypothetical protein